MRKQDVVDAVESALIDEGVSIGLREDILDDVWRRLDDEMIDEDDD